MEACQHSNKLGLCLSWLNVHFKWPWMQAPSKKKTPPPQLCFYALKQRAGQEAWTVTKAASIFWLPFLWNLPLPCQFIPRFLLHFGSNNFSRHWSERHAACFVFPLWWHIPPNCSISLAACLVEPTKEVNSTTAGEAETGYVKLHFIQPMETL